MIDFTKEELVDIHYPVTEYWDMEMNKILPLADKIQSLIDNYSIHLDTSELETQTR